MEILPLIIVQISTLVLYFLLPISRHFTSHCLHILNSDLLVILFINLWENSLLRLSQSDFKVHLFCYSIRELLYALCSIYLMAVLHLSTFCAIFLEKSQDGANIQGLLTFLKWLLSRELTHASLVSWIAIDSLP